MEHAIQRVVRERNYLARFELRASEALRATEMKDLERLEAKYRTPQKPQCDVTEPEEAPGATDQSTAPAAGAPVQFSLF